MWYSYVLLALATLAEATPAQLVARQGVTIATSPTAPPPAGCTASADYSFGIHVYNVSTSGVAKRALVTEISE